MPKQTARTAQELTGDSDHYTKTGARAMVKAGRGGWTLEPSWLRGFSGFRLWRKGRRSVGTTPTGELYGEDN